MTIRVLFSQGIDVVKTIKMLLMRNCVWLLSLLLAFAQKAQKCRQVNKLEPVDIVGSHYHVVWMMVEGFTIHGNERPHGFHRCYKWVRSIDRRYLRPPPTTVSILP